MQEWKVIVPIRSERKYPEVEAEILKLASGYSCYTGYGMWVSPKGEEIQEFHKVYYFATAAESDTVFAFMRNLRRITGEACIYAAKTGEAFLV